MNQQERLNYLVERFTEDSGEYKNLQVGDSEEEKRTVLRSLMNIRMPGSISETVLKIQNEFLTEDAKEKGIVSLDSIPTVKEQYGSSHPFADKISVWQGDITRLEVGAIVNAANCQMLGCFVPCHRCIDNAIHSAAGIQLRNECDAIMKSKKMQYGRHYQEPTGTATLTHAYNLPCDYVIHTVGPIVGYKLTDKLRQDLRNCYESVLKCALEQGIRSIAFCCISTGEFHFPNDESAEIAVDTVTAFLKEHGEEFDRVIFNVFKEQDKELYQAQFE